MYFQIPRRIEEESRGREKREVVNEYIGIFGKMNGFRLNY